MSATPFSSPAPIHGRGVQSNPPNRFERLHLEPDPDCPPEEAPHPCTQFYVDSTESLLVHNDSPDVGFSWGINPYRGCEHGCVYCYARPSHEYLGFSSGLDFETKIMVKLRAPELLRRELSSPRWKPQVVAVSGNTDCYQPAERRFRLTRACLEVFAEFRNPVAMITKNALVTRDRDLLGAMAQWHGVAVNLTITTLDAELASKLEPRAARPEHRLRALRLLTEAGVQTGVMVAPVIPGLTDHEIPAILDAAAAAGARHAGYVLLRLPHAVKTLFLEWLETHIPSKKARIIDRIHELRGGKLNATGWGVRQRGEGIFAEQIETLFTASARRAGLNQRSDELSTTHFRRLGGTQLELF